MCNECCKDVSMENPPKFVNISEAVPPCESPTHKIWNGTRKFKHTKEECIQLFNALNKLDGVGAGWVEEDKGTMFIRFRGISFFYGEWFGIILTELHCIVLSPKNCNRTPTEVYTIFEQLSRASLEEPSMFEKDEK